MRWAVFRHVARMLSCRTPKLGLHMFLCDRCGTVKVVPHSCKSAFCTSCGEARTDQWCKGLLSDMLDVSYRHLVFTIPWELRLLIQDNRAELLDVLFRAAAQAIQGLTGGTAALPGRKSQKWLKARNPRKKFLPGVLIVLHTFGSDSKWNSHRHIVLTAGGLSLTKGLRIFAHPIPYEALALCRNTVLDFGSKM